jgi:hypothetical protein
LIINRHNSTSPYRYGSFILILCFIHATLGKKILVESLYSALLRFQAPAAFPPSPEAPSFLHLPTSLLLVFLNSFTHHHCKSPLRLLRVGMVFPVFIHCIVPNVERRR